MECGMAVQWPRALPVQTAIVCRWSVSNNQHRTTRHLEVENSNSPDEVKTENLQEKPRIGAQNAYHKGARKKYGNAE